LAIELPLQATTTRPPGTSKTNFPVDGDGVGDGDCVTLEVAVPAMAPDVAPDGDGDVVCDAEGEGVGEVGVTTPPIAFPFAHR
jgi:hypothetical protein